jgi:CDP-glucose 4,6-dehydratase
VAYVVGLNDRAIFWRGRSVLVTGAGGFVGSWLAYALAGLGAEVTVIIRDRPSVSNFKLLDLPERVNVVDGTITDQALVERVVAEHEISACFHLGAQAIVGVANQSPMSTFDANIRGTWTVLEACRRSRKVDRVVVASSDKAYGDQGPVAYSETMPLLGANPYDVSKVCTESLARCYQQSLGLPVAIARCANIYGGGDLNYVRLVPGTVRAALRRQHPVIRSDGSPVRDFLYVDDAVSAYLTIAENLDQEEVFGQAFNFGADTPLSVLELTNHILALCDAADMKPVILGDGPVPGEIQTQFMSAVKANEILRWVPAVSLDEGLRATIRWYRNHLARTAVSRIAAS